jgi:hypothetical protein
LVFGHRVAAVRVRKERHLDDAPPAFEPRIAGRRDSDVA